MREHTFNIGDTVKRIKGTHLDMKPGDIDKIVDLDKENGLILQKYKASNGNPGSHAYYNFELVESGVTNFEF